MDQTNKLFSGDIKDLGSALESIDDKFRGVLRFTVKTKNQVYEADMLLRDGLIIAASRRNIENNETIYGEEAYEEVLSCSRKKTGKVELYFLSELDFKAIVDEQENILLEKVREISSLVNKEKPAEAIETGDLEKSWKKLEDEFQELDKKDAAYIAELLKKEPVESQNKQEIEKPLSFDVITEEAREELKTEEAQKDEKEPRIMEPTLTDQEILEEVPNDGGLPEPDQDIAKEGSQTNPSRPAIAEKAAEAKENLLDKTSQEIQQMKKEVGVYWGWDDKKKKFVGKETIIEEKRQEPALPSQQQQEPKTLEESKEASAVVPTLTKKLGFRDKLFYLTTPKVIRVLERIDGKKTMEDISKETGIDQKETRYILEQLKKDGYLTA